MFGIALGGSMCITLFLPSFDFRSAVSTDMALDKQLSAGWETGWNIYDPLMLGKNKPLKVLVREDPKTGQPLAQPFFAYIYKKGTPLPNGVDHPDNLGGEVQTLSLTKGDIKQAKWGAPTVYLISHQGNVPYIEDATATRGWTPDMILSKAHDSDIHHDGAGKTLFVREGCWWCHTLLPEETQDWQVFGAPPMLGDFNGESPTAFGSDRKAPDLLHVGSRNSSRQWMTLHFFNPRLVQPHSIMPRFDYLWGDKDAHGNKIDYAKWRQEYNEYRAGKRTYPPAVPDPAPNSEARDLIDWVLSLK
jgi:cytochrome c oxidase cbb3-type subunit 2